MRTIINFLLDLVFPKFCLGCKREGIWLCKKCYKKIIINKKQCCPICHKNNKYGQTCNECLNISNVDGLLISCSYENEIIKKCISFYKYQFIRELYLPLSCLMIKTINQTNPPDLRNSLIIPIPLHHKRLIERGYNQSALLAKHIAKKINMPYYNKLLKRIKYTEKQATLPKKDRLINVNGVFQVKNGFDFRDKNVIIVDDVATTLATLNSSAKQLKKAGANQVWGLVIARGNFK